MRAALVWILLLEAGLATNHNQCNRPWPLGNDGSFDPGILAYLNNKILSKSAARHLITWQLEQDPFVHGNNHVVAGNVADHDIHIIVTFPGEAVNAELHSGCLLVKSIQYIGESFGKITDASGSILNRASSLQEAGHVVFTPNENFSGEVVFIYSYSSPARNDTIFGAIIFQVIPCSLALVAFDDHIVTNISPHGERINVLANDISENEYASMACIEPFHKNDLPYGVSDGEDDTNSLPTVVNFKNIAAEIGIVAKQAEVRTSPNCLFDQFDPVVKKWDSGGFCLQETLTGGACIGDADGDGFDDIFYPRLDGADILYRNRGDGSFEDISDYAGLSSQTRVHSNACAFVDIDNDGDNDIYISTVAETQFLLFVNDGMGVFTEESRKRGLENFPGVFRFHGINTAGGSIGIADFDLDGYLDIVTTEWLPHLGKKNDPEKFDWLHNKKGGNNARIFRNRGDSQPGYFDDVTQEAGMKHMQTGGRRPQGTEISRRYDFGTNEEIKEALACVEPLVQQDDVNQTKIATEAKYILKNSRDDKETRSSLKRKYRIAMNAIMGRDLNHDFYGIRHPIVGTWRGSAFRPGRSNHSHTLVVLSNMTWNLEDIIYHSGDSTLTLVVEASGVWKEDDESDYIAYFKETFRRTFIKQQNGSKTLVNNPEPLTSSDDFTDDELKMERVALNRGLPWAQSGDWIRIDCIGSTPGHMRVSCKLYETYIFSMKL